MWQRLILIVIVAVLVATVPEPAYAALDAEKTRHLVRAGVIGMFGIVAAAWRFKQGDGMLGVTLWTAAFVGAVAFLLYPPPQLARMFM